MVPVNGWRNISPIGEREWQAGERRPVDSTTVTVHYRIGSTGTDIALSSPMLRRFTEHVRKWLFSGAAVSRMIRIDGGTLRVETGTSRTVSLSFYRLRVPVPGKKIYGVEYKVAAHGEFTVERGRHGGMVLRNRYATSCSIPVCWMPERFLGKSVDRYITQIDGRRVHYKACNSERPSRQPGGRFLPPASHPSSHN